MKNLKVNLSRDTIGNKFLFFFINVNTENFVIFKAVERKNNIFSFDWDSLSIIERTLD